jgi:predicted PurR-regulated permease PerM
MPISISKAASSSIVGIYRLLLFIFIIGCLYFGEPLLIPFILAMLLTFLLSPLATWLERWVGRVISIISVTLICFMFIGMIGYMITNQFIDFTTKLPDYRLNIENKLNTFHLSKDDALTRVLDTIDKLKSHLPGQTPAQPSSKLSLGINPAPVPVNIIESPSSKFSYLATNFLASLLDILGSTGLVFLLLIFMLFAREDLRGRFIQLIGPRRISATTRAMDDASNRVSQYLLAQLLLNFTYGVLIAVGLHLIGIPNAILWGILAFLLRFIPYLGAWISAILPFIVALAITDNWLTPLFVILLFGSLDLITANVIEPLIYSSQTGVSAFALIVSAVFWTLLWGPMGLLLSVPITVCIVVMGQYIPSLSFLSVMLGENRGLALYEECYQRLINGEFTEASLIINNYLKNNSLPHFYDSFLIPILTAAETDYRQELIEEEQLNLLYQAVEDLLEDRQNHQDMTPLENKENTDTSKNSIPYEVLCAPLGREQDELASIMLTQLLDQTAFHVKNVPGKLNKEALFEDIKKANYSAICIIAVAPAPLNQARALCAALHRQFPQIKIVVCLLGFTQTNPDFEERFRLAGADSIVFMLEQAVLQLDKYRVIIR